MHLARKESPSRDRSFERFLLRAVDEELSSLGDSLAKQRFYLYLEKEFNVNRHDIPRKFEEFAGAIEKIFGEGAKFLEFWVSYGPMFFPSFKEWYRGIECLHELAVQRAFKDDNPYDKIHDEINKAVAKLICVDEVKYNSLERIKEVTGDGSFQALDASYPIHESFWPDWLKIEVEKFRRYRSI